MSGTKKDHHKGTHHRRSALIRQAAAANPLTKCWRCGRTLAQHPPQRNGKPARWTAGHLIDGMRDGPLAPEASTCNFSAGAAAGNRRRGQGRTDLTW